MEEVLRELTETELASVAGGLTTANLTINNQDSNQGIQAQFAIDNPDSNQGVQGIHIGSFTFPPVSP
jgi:bacteriocin-like protein